LGRLNSHLGGTICVSLPIKSRYFYERIYWRNGLSLPLLEGPMGSIRNYFGILLLSRVFCWATRPSWRLEYWTLLESDVTDEAGVPSDLVHFIFSSTRSVMALG
jgi:hypothetical protein